MKKIFLLLSVFSIFFILVMPQSSVLAGKKFSPRMTKPTTISTTTTTSISTTPTLTTLTTPVITSTDIGWTNRVIYDGYGTVVTNDLLRQLSMSPKAATQPSETHAALVVSQQTVHQPFQLSYTMKTTQQLRTGSVPNAWEVGWLVFGYKSTGAFKYLILKPNGLELGESLLNNVQTFLYTSSNPFPINTDDNVVLRVENNIVTATVNGVVAMRYTMSAKDSLTADGQYGFYTEDAAVQVSNISMKQL